MKKVYGDYRVPIKTWLGVSELEEGAFEQAKNLTDLPFVFRHIALMPDCHQGYGMPIGGVMATRDYVVPNAVGVDIGCGMCALYTGLNLSLVKPHLKDIVDEIKMQIPVGFNKHQVKQKEWLDGKGKLDLFFLPLGVIDARYEHSLFQLGTLGGGNHFIELQKDENDGVWIMIHSGSRNLGKQVADHYNKIAKELNEKWQSVSVKDLAYLPLDSVQGKSYLMEMEYCVEYALANRKLMMDRVVEIFNACFDKNITNNGMINIAHNYATMENHFKHNVLVHRKGATRARLGEIGIIPGSQGSNSYIVEGLGNKESFMSCSHGAGRNMGRKKAIENLNLADEIEILDNQGIIHNIKTAKDLDEATGAYKDINIVMDNQSDLVKIIVKLTPLAVIKG